MSPRYRFGPFELLSTERRLLRGGLPITLRPRAFDLLAALVEQRGALVTKQALMDRVWPGLVVEESNVQVQVSGLRRLLGAELIATVPGLGYRLALPCVPVHAAASPPPPPSQSPRPGPAPPPASVDRLFGREPDIEALLAWLHEHRLVTVLGSGGLGKTRVAQEVAQRHAQAAGEAAVWVDLAPVADAQQLPARLAAALGIDLPPGTADALPSLQARLQPGAPLIVFDNCEHLAPAVGLLAGRLLRALPGLRLLCTSQLRLKAAGERVYRLQPLALPRPDMPWDAALACSALALLLHRARAADHRFTLAPEHLPAVAGLLRRLDGVPLAIEMAAARLPQLGLTTLGHQLADWVRLLRSPQIDAPARQSTLRATLDWSHSLLAPREQAVLRRLAPFVGGFTLPTAQAALVQGGLDPWDALEALGALADSSLLQGQPGEPPRHRLLETTRLLAQQQLAAHGEGAAAEQAHGHAMAAWAEQIEEAFWQLPDRDWLARHAADQADLQAAFERACERRDVEVAALTGTALARLDFLRNLHGERRRRAEALHALLPLASPRARAWAWHCIASHGLITLQAVSRQEAAAQAVLAWQALDDTVRLHGALCFQAAMCARAQAFDEAEAALARAQALEQPDWPARRRLWRASMTATVWGHRGDLARFRAASAIELQLADEAGAERSAAWVRLKLADAARSAGALDEALALGEVAVAAMRAANSPADLGLSLCHLAAAWLLKGQTAPVRALLAEALPLMWANGWAHLLQDTLALQAARTARPRDAARLLGCADAWYGAHRDTRLAGEAQLVACAEALIAQRLSPASAATLRAQGAALGDAQARRLCLALLAPDSDAPA
ncbi:ATP-binding protein [Aquabacterium sp.]|uniref:ATP-binding protein n=1 Tax=Aquabacterium sp. TaxID=1872578 RepID=UPI0037834E45